MRHLLACLFLAPLGIMAQTIEYTWPNQACVQMLHCDSGCSACNVPESTSVLLVGSNLSAVGVDVCPRSMGNGDTALDTYGWPIQPLPGHRVVLSGMAMVPVALDSLVVEHGSGTDGPQRLELSLGLNGAPPVVVADMAIPDQGAVVLTDLGALLPGEGQVFGTYQLTFRAYLGNGGPWTLDAVRLVFGEQVLATSLVEHGRTEVSGRAPLTDLLGRTVDASRPRGHLIGRGVVVVP